MHFFNSNCKKIPAGELELTSNWFQLLFRKITQP